MGPPSFFVRPGYTAISLKTQTVAREASSVHCPRMPKKFKGTNSKAEEARARKDAVRLAEKERKQKEEEDKYWEDNDKHVMKKQQRKVRSCL